MRPRRRFILFRSFRRPSGWFSPSVSRHPPSERRSDSESLSLFPYGPLCGTEYKFPRPSESALSSFPHPVAPASSRLATALVQTASSGCAACLPGTDHHVCESPQILFAHHTAIEYPDPARLAVLTLNHPQDRF